MFLLTTDNAPIPKTKDGHYFLDVNPTYFELILDYLRHGKITTENPDLLKGMRELANFFNLKNLLNTLETRVNGNLSQDRKNKTYYQTTCKAICQAIGTGIGQAICQEISNIISTDETVDQVPWPEMG